MKNHLFAPGLSPGWFGGQYRSRFDEGEAHVLAERESLPLGLVLGVGCRDEGVGFGVQGLGFGVEGFGFRVWVWGSKFRV